ncbi:MAG: S-methyl-5-thioribose-1-phosphate isomerase [Cyanobacteria bacterium P01_A01_bin.37]
MADSGFVYSILWNEDHVSLIDQTRLPREFTLVEVRRCDDMIRAIQTLIVRGTPVMAVAAAYGLYMGAREIEMSDRDAFMERLEAIAQSLIATRPTGVNLSRAINHMMAVAQQSTMSVDETKQLLLDTAKAIHAEDLRICHTIGNNGLQALPQEPQKLKILTCGNAGALATTGYGTSLGVVRSLHRAERLERVFVCETRPRLQGARLTVWECVQESIPVTVITDSMAAHCMSQGMVDAVVVGADRIAANGDTAYKIGTYGLALMARAHDIPFYVATSLNSVDFSLLDGQHIPIEKRDASEIYQIGETTLCAKGSDFYNPGFDVTPADMITAIITEHGIQSPSCLRDVEKTLG